MNGDSIEIRDEEELSRKHSTYLETRSSITNGLQEFKTRISNIHSNPSTESFVMISRLQATILSLFVQHVPEHPKIYEQRMRDSMRLENDST